MAVTKQSFASCHFDICSQVGCLPLILVTGYQKATQVLLTDQPTWGPKANISNSGAIASLGLVQSTSIFVCASYTKYTHLYNMKINLQTQYVVCESYTKYTPLYNMKINLQTQYVVSSTFDVDQGIWWRKFKLKILVMIFKKWED